MKYLGERKRHWIERAFWIIAFGFSVYGCSTMILKIYNKWQLSPVIVSFAEKSTPVWQIPFPAVTICPETKSMTKYIKFSKAYNMAMRGQSENLTIDELKNLEALAQVCDPHLFGNFSVDSGLELDEIVPLLQMMKMPLNETTLFCKWRNNVQLCENYFTEILTEEGYCYTFNVLRAEELFREEV